MSISEPENSFANLVDLLARLRGPDGCPWDQKQTHSSLKRFLLEETYEVLEAIDQGSPKKMSEELGDVLLQVLFQSQIAKEAGEFSIVDVTNSLKEKLVRRHPHVFGDMNVKNSQEVEELWEEVKLKENEQSTSLGHIPLGMPALAHSQLMQERASKTGFDWNEFTNMLEKVTEEIQEIRASSSEDERANEFGDLLMVLVNVGIHLGVNSEDALRTANHRFQSRFTTMETMASEQGLVFKELPLASKEELWHEVKARGHKTSL
jgi:tetrapyrrole methylase family protein/MazG family protein